MARESMKECIQRFQWSVRRIKVTIVSLSFNECAELRVLHKRTIHRTQEYAPQILDDHIRTLYPRSTREGDSGRFFVDQSTGSANSHDGICFTD